MPTQPNATFTRLESALIAIALAVVVVCWWTTPQNTSRLLGNTVQLAVAVLLISWPLAAILAYSLARCSVPAKWFWESCLLVLLFLPLYIQLASWEAGFGRGGWYSMLIAERLSNPPLEGFRGAVWVHAMAAIPWLFWILRLGLAAIPRTYEEAAMLDATPWQVFRRITAPLALPLFFAGGFYVLIVASTEITVTDRYQFRSYAEVLYNEFVLNSPLDVPLNLSPILALMVAVAVLGLAMCKLIWPRLIHATSNGAGTCATKTDWIAALVVMILVCLLLFVPVGDLVYQAGIEVVHSASGQRVREWSPAKLLRVIASSPLQYRIELAWTALLAQFSMLAAIFAATVAAWCARKRHGLQLFNTLVSIICFVTPGPLIGLSIIFACRNRRSPEELVWLFDDTLFAPWLAMTIRCFPFAYLVVWYGIRSIPQTLFEAAEADGASSLATFRFVALPLLKPSLLCAAIVCLAVSVGELSASVLVMPAGVTTVATQIFSLIHYGAEDRLAGLCLACLGLFAGLSMLARLTLQALLRGQRIRT